MSPRDDFEFLHPLRVRWADCDLQGVVFYPEYFVYFDVAMTEYLRRLGFDGPIVAEFLTVHAEADYRGSARMDDEIQVGVRCTRLGRSSMTLGFGIFREEEVLTEGFNTYVHVDGTSHAPKPLPDDLVETIMAFEKVPPERQDVPTRN